jgi:energy-coupling factor transporter ATP-binding protein EcfA2
MPQRQMPTDFLTSPFTSQGFTLAHIELKNIGKQWGDTVGVKRMSLGISDGELLVLLGSSGSGNKNTVRIEAGLENPTSTDESMGIAPTGQKITMRRLDFWRCKNDLIRENWVPVAWLHGYKQIGVDVMPSMCEFNKARVFQYFQGYS